MITAMAYAFHPANIVRELTQVSKWGQWFIPLCSALIVYLCFTWGSAWWEILSAVAGVFCVVLVADRKLTNFFWGLLNCSLYGLTSYHNGFYGDMSLNWLLYVPFQFMGLAAWYKSTVDEEVISKRLALSETVVTLFALLISWIVLGSILVTFNGNHPFIDASNVVLSIAATILMWRCYREQWVCWMMVNITGITMWGLNAYHGNGEGVAALAMWVAFLINSSYGFYSWTKASKEIGQVSGFKTT
ncbi:PnuC-like nicotinamide mononucleotide transport [Aeromonas phage 1233]|nr:PnuC-like nicotinamide mononucleotide transport [Aeromonas phage 1233]